MEPGDRHQGVVLNEEEIEPMRTVFPIALAVLAASPLSAQHVDQPAAQAPAVENSEEAAVRAVLAQYKEAIERLDATGTELLFTADSAIFETGGVEGTYANYLAHHLGPELKEFRSFRFSNYQVDVRFEGPVALATETYNYRIETNDGEVAERRGVATSVLRRENGAWKIAMMHNSARRPPSGS